MCIRLVGNWWIQFTHMGWQVFLHRWNSGEKRPCWFMSRIGRRKSRMFSMN